MQEINDISKQPLVEWGGQVVITTAQLAKAYGTTAKNVSNNFSRNKDRFEVGKHYFVLQGEELKEFMRVSSESGLPSSTSIAYLWTRRGASRHCKILGTDKAWEQFDYLEDYYFDRKKQSLRPPMTIAGQIQLLAQGHVELEAKIDSIKADLEQFKDDLPLLGIEESRITRAVKKKGVECLGGKQAPAYKDKSLRARLYCDMHQQLRREFDVSSYKAIRRSQADTAVSIIQRYAPPLAMADTIRTVNAQQTMEV